jgi:hypothetical protein
MLVVMKDFEKDIQTAETTADEVEALRQDLRWNVKPGEEDRETQITDALRNIRDAMEPVRSGIGHAIHGHITAGQEKRLRVVSERLQYSRKQLKKMRRA